MVQLLSYHVVLIIFFLHLRFKGNVCGGNDGYAHINVQEHSVIHFLCPSSSIIISIQNKFSNQLNMYENMFLVSKKEFDECRVESPTQKSVLDCDSPKQSNSLLYRRFYFSSFTSSSKQFFPNETYYFIGKSSLNFTFMYVESLYFQRTGPSRGVTFFCLKTVLVFSLYCPRPWENFYLICTTEIVMGWLQR